MNYTRQQIVDDIKQQMAKSGGAHKDWYVGIASDPRQRLFSDHNVDEKNGCWIFRQCESSTAARKVEDYFINTVGTDGGSGGGDDTTDCVCAYQKTSITRE